MEQAGPFVQHHFSWLEVDFEQVTAGALDLREQHNNFTAEGKKHLLRTRICVSPLTFFYLPLPVKRGEHVRGGGDKPQVATLH